jgi:hypothetical protein
MKDSVVTINVAKEFSTRPIGRDKNDGKFNGEKFREEFIVPRLDDENISEININLNDLAIVGSSFLEEAFGGLIRKGYSRDDISKINFIASDEDYIIEIDEYIDDAVQKKDVQ